MCRLLSSVPRVLKSKRTDYGKLACHKIFFWLFRILQTKPVENMVALQSVLTDSEPEESLDSFLHREPAELFLYLVRVFEYALSFSEF